MAVSQALYAKSIFNAMRGSGDKVMASDATFVIEGLESSRFLIKAFPMPVLTPGEGAEIPMQMGLKKWQVTQAKINQQGSFTISENVAGDAAKLTAHLMKCGGKFRAKVYEGTPEQFLRYYQLEECSMNAEPVDRAWDDNTTTVDITGQVQYHYFGEIVEGTSKPDQAFAGLACN